MSEQRYPQDWQIEDGYPDAGRWIRLITASHLAFLPAGTVLHSILGEQVVVGVDEIDLDTRGGYLAYGFMAPLTGAQA